MPSFTDFLKLSLPALSEFTDSWNEPMNQNFEDIDNWTEDLYKGLSTTGASSLWASLRGNTASLVARLAVSIDNDGNINVSTSQPFLDMQTSAYYTDPADVFTTPRDRLNDGDRRNYEAGQPFPNGRFVPTDESGPSAGYPHAELDAGIAIRSADFGAKALVPVSSPQKPWAPGLILGGSSTFINPAGIGMVDILAASPAIFNIDGYVFRLRDNIRFDYNGISPNPSEYVWIYVDRAEAGYANADFKFSEPTGTPIARDLRVIKSGSGTTTIVPNDTNTFSASGSPGFDSEPFKVKEGDTLRILTGGDAGDYVIDALDGATPDDKLTIKGKFKVGNLTAGFEIIDNAMPSIGAVVPTANPTESYALPDYVAGRVYIGRVLHNAGGNPTEAVTFAKAGVYDSGWLVGTTTDFPHELGAIPSRIEISVRADSTAPAQKPLVLRQIQTAGGPLVEGAPNTTTYNLSNLLLPSLWQYADERNIKVGLVNQTDESTIALFTDFTGAPADVAALNGQIRIVAWR
jgi:hypothetical protein